MYDYGYTSPSDYETASNILGGLLAMSGIIILISLAAGIVMLISQWKIYKKAGKGGWESLIPIYNIIVLIQIVELPMWYIALFFIPFANIYAMFKIYIELAHKFGKSTGFGVATAFFSVICLPILAFGKDNVYNGGTGTQSINNNQPNQVNNLNQPQPQPNLENSNMNFNNTNTEAPISFNQNIDTNITPIQSSEPINNQSLVSNPIPNEPINQGTIEQNNLGFNQQPETPQPMTFNRVEMPQTPNQPEVNIISNVQEPQSIQVNSNIELNNSMNLTQQPVNQNIQTPQPETISPFESQPINVIPTIGESSQNPNNNQNNSNK